MPSPCQSGDSSSTSASGPTGRPRGEFPAIAPAVAAACASVAPFVVTLGRFGSFRHGSGRCTLWLAPEPAGGLRRLQAVLQVAFPDCDDLGRFPAGFTPHLSLGQFPSSQDCERVGEQLQAGWRPLSFVLGTVALLARGADSPFVVDRRVPLGSPVQEG